MVFKKGQTTHNKIMFSNRDIRTIEELSKKEVLTKEIAKKFNCSVSPIYRVLKERNIKIFHKGHFRKGESSWNKGLTKENDIRIKRLTEKAKRTKDSQEWHKNHKRRKDLDDKEIIKEYKKIKSASLVARRFRCGVQTIYYILRRNNIKREGHRTSRLKSSLRVIKKEYFENKKSCKEIGEMFNVSFSAIRKILKKKGFKLRQKPSKRTIKKRMKTIKEKGLDFTQNLGKYAKKGSSLIQFRKMMKEVRAKQVFPVKDSSIEVKIQNFLKQLGIEFFTHQYMKEIEHGYQCDILIPSMNLVIECDGDYWHKYPTGREIDHIRTSELLEKGFKVLRLWECEIRVMDINKFKESLKNCKEKYDSYLL